MIFEKRRILMEDNKKEQLVVCSNSGCVSSGSVDVFIKLLDRVYNDPDLSDKYVVKKGGCHGFCEVGPTLIAGNDKVFYIKLTEEKIDDIIESHLKNGIIAEKYCFYDLLHKKRILFYDEIPFIAKQNRLILKDSPFYDPEDIDDYIAGGGFKALEKVLANDNQIEICRIIKDSGLRGRGGGGFHTGDKWLKQAEQISQPKYVICNGDEGDPGTYMDRSLLEGDPYRVLEGLLIAGYATMSNIGIVYTRNDYDLALSRIKSAIQKLYERGYAGNSVMGKQFSFDIKLEIAPGAYITGEETALIASLESRRGNPRVKPPYPIENGLFGNPTMVNNVETLSNIRDIILNTDAYSKFGSDESKGTKLLTLSGAVKNSGLVEMPFGITFNELINEIGGGMLKVSKLKAIQIGGSSGTILPASMIHEQISFENLKKFNASIGAGGVVVLDENTCIIELAKFYIEFSEHESCGFCVPCREGTQKILNILNRIIDGNGKIDDIEKLKNISMVMYQTSLCGLGKEASNPILGMLHYFEDELKEHIIHKKCRAGVCPKLVRYKIEKDSCIGCGACTLNCPVNAIVGTHGQYHTIDGELCIRCGQCYKVCPKDAITRS
ncbi:MAG TPA: NADH-quinone oxidoreductase subunit F [Spirochaetia bacterium]|nr:NADH-quinone oxidoreductase subunit F [Spirochaetia bacterium]HBI37652.1 NADH-quinone oxidoreductase subunit F [Spirochaetia bacterium]